MFVSHRKQNRYEPNRLILSIGLWWWYINITITSLDVMHCPVCNLKHMMGDIRTSQETHVFYLNTGWIMFVSHRKQNRIEPNRLILSIGLWRWYINITITSLDVMHRPVCNLTHMMSDIRTSQETHVFYLNTGWIMFVSHRKQNRYEPNRLILSIGLWRWYINRTISVLDIIHRPAFYLKHRMCNVRTSQETHYVTATKSNRLLLYVPLWEWYFNRTNTILRIVHLI
jgi:hypothetical protein